VHSLIIQNIVATFPIDNCGPIFQPAHKVKFEVDPNYMLFPSIVYLFSFMIPVIHICFPVPTTLFSHDRLDILLVPVDVKSTKTRKEKHMIGRLKDVLKQCGVMSCEVWCGVASPRLRCVRVCVCVCVCVCVRYLCLCVVVWFVVWCGVVLCGTSFSEQTCMFVVCVCVCVCSGVFTYTCAGTDRERGSL